MPDGRPTEYNPEMNEKVQEWVKEGIVNTEIAKRLGIAESTLYDWKLKHPEFSEAFKKGEDYRHRNVVNSLYKRCMGYEYEEVTKERILVEGENGQKKPKTVETKRVIKQVAPDPTSMIFYLTNKLPDEYKHKSEVNNNITGNLNIKSDKMTEEEKKSLIQKVYKKLEK